MADLTAFIEAATWHGGLERAAAILAAHPEIATGSIQAAAILGDEATVRRLLALDPASATAKAPPYDGDALNYLGLSKYLRLHPERTDDFLRTATVLLDAGAPAQTGFWHNDEFETALYGAAGVAHNERLTRLLIERGADPNDEDTVYHSPEGFDLGAMKALVETGKLTEEHLALMLIRKHDWHDYEGAKYLLEHGASPKHIRKRGWQPLHHALERDNDLPIIELLLDHGADPAGVEDGLSGTALAVRRGRSDVLEALERRGLLGPLPGALGLIAACARGDAAAVRTIAEREPHAVRDVLADGAGLLAEFTGNWNVKGARLLLDLGVPADALYAGDGYFGIAKHSRRCTSRPGSWSPRR